MPEKIKRKTMKFTVGILEVQGAFLEHKIALLQAAKTLEEDVDVDVIGIRNASHVTSGVNGMIIPGGESTTISLFLKRNKMEDVLREWINDRKHVTWGTCAGMILLSKNIEHQKEGGQSTLGVMDTLVSRNYFGRQINSFEADLTLNNQELVSSIDTFRGVFIRAPAVVKTTSSDVEVLSTLCDEKSEPVIVACRQGNVMVTAFHPELTEDTRWHRYFLRMLIDNSK